MRERVVKATAAALQPKSLDLTQFRQRSIHERPLKLRAEDAAGALAYSAMDREDGPGDKLRPALLRLKYAQQRGTGIFGTAVKELLLRCDQPAPPHCAEIAYAVAVVALFEWLNDACPECRGGNVRKVRSIAVQCSFCHNTGRSRGLSKRERWSKVSDYLRSAHQARKQPYAGLPMKRFEQWSPILSRMLGELKAADRAVASGVDLRLVASVRDSGPECAGNDDEA